MSRNGKRLLRAKVVQRKLQRQQDKERVKLAHHVVKLQQANALDPGPQFIQDLKDQLEANRRGVNELIDAHNVNFKTYTDAFQHLDARLGAIMHVLNDVTQLLNLHNLLDEEVLTTTTSAKDGKVQPFWEAYIAQYLSDVAKAAADSKLALGSFSGVIAESSDSDYADMEFGGEGMKHVEASAGG